MASKLMEVFSTKVVIKVELLQHLYDKYERDAKDGGRTVEEEISRRLHRCVEHLSDRPLYIPDAERNELERLLGGHFLKSPGQLVARVAASAKVKVGDVTIELPANLLTRLKSRVFRGQSFEGNIRKWVIEGLERVGGIRPW